MRKPQQKTWRRAAALAAFLAAFLLAFLSGWHVVLAFGGTGNGNGNGNTSPCSGPNPPAYCTTQSNWTCTGTDVGTCQNNLIEVVYPAGCPQSTQWLSCSDGHCQGKSVFQYCTGCGEGMFEPTNSCTGGANGADYQGPASWCTTGCPTQSQTPSSTPTSSSSSAPTSSATPPSSSAPSCTPSSTSSPVGSSFSPTGCAGSCTSTGCSNTGVETGIQTNTTQTCTTNSSCQTSCSDSSSSFYTTQYSPNQCQQVENLLDQCMPNEPGYREAEYCLSFNGGYTNCSAPFGVYDPTNCPVPVGVN